MSSYLKRLFGSFVAIVIGLFFSVTSGAATIPVNENTCTLMNAILAANNNVATGGCPKGDPDAIATDIIEISSGMTIMMSSFHYSTQEAFPFITSKMTINGNGATVARDTVQVCDDETGECTGSPNYRLFHVKGATGILTINALTVTGGSVYEDAKTSQSGNGGGVYNEGGTVLLNACTITGNSATYGGGVYNSYGTLTIQKSIISNNYGSWGAGGIFSNGNVFTMTDSTVIGNNAPAAFATGGGVRINGGDSKLSRVSIINNSSSKGGGFSIGSGTVAVENSTIAQNSSSDGGAAVYMTGTKAVTFTYDTITANLGNQGLGGGGIYTDFGVLPEGALSPLSLRNTYLAGNTASNSPDCSAYLTSLGGNILSTYVLQLGSGCKITAQPTDIQFNPIAPVIDSKLLTLGNPGTMYYPLTLSSPAIGKALTCVGCPTIDQLSSARNATKPTVGAIEGVLPQSVCADGIIGVGEACDTNGPMLLGNTCVSIGQGFGGGTLGCNADCKSYDVSKCTLPGFCGDGVKNTATEDCDKADLNKLTCVALGKGFDGGPLACKADCTFDVSQCTSPDVCGDGKKTGVEVCDGFNLGGKDCMSIPGGYVAGNLKCAADCKSFDTSACIAPPQLACKDGKKNGAEVCDGQDFGGASCVSLGFASGALSCTETCTIDTAKCVAKVITSCGDGKMNGIEACDESDFGKKSCEGLNLGFTGGVLKCTDKCVLDLAGCTTPSKGGVPAVIETLADTGGTTVSPPPVVTTTPTTDSTSVGVTSGTSTGCSLIR